MGGVRVAVVAGLSCLGVLVPSSDARPQSRATLVPSLSISTIHDDNLFTVSRPTGDLMTELRPSFEGSFESSTVDLFSLVSFDAQVSANHPGLNRLDARRHAEFDGRFRTSPRALLGLAAAYDKTDSPGELDLDTAVLQERQRAQRWQVAPSLSYRMTPRTSLMLQYDWTDETLSGRTSPDMHVGRIAFSRNTSPRTVWSAHFVGRLFVDPAVRHRSGAALLGWSHELAPGTNLTFRAGPRGTTYRGMTAEVLAAFIRQTPRNRFLVDYWHGETVILGIVGPVRIQSGTTKFRRVIRRNFELGMNVGLFDSRTLDEAEATVVHASAVGAWIPRQPYIISVSYGADFQRGDIRSPLLSEQHVRRGVLSVRLTIAPRFSRAFRPRDDEPDEPSRPLKGVIR